MSILYKDSSGALTTSQLVFNASCFYYGFVCVTGGSSRAIVLYDSMTNAGKAIETYTCDGNKPTDGHSHSKPVFCQNGLYLSTPGGGETITIFFSPNFMER